MQHEETYKPSSAEAAYGSAIKTFSTSLRPSMPVYYEGSVRYVYTDTWTLVPFRNTNGVARSVKQRTKNQNVQDPHLGSLVGRCERCEKHRRLTRHHVVHRSKGGGSGDNLQMLCWPCHSHAHNVIKVPSGTRVPPMNAALYAAGHTFDPCIPYRS